MRHDSNALWPGAYLAEKQLPEALYTAEQVRQLDSIAINDFGMDGFELMTRAARATFQTLLSRWPDASSVQVFCGSGNNGGDGYLIALLAAEKGLSVEVLYLSSPEKLSGDALKAYHASQKQGVHMIPYTNSVTLSADVLVDAMLGTGLTRAVGGSYQQAIQQINAAGKAVLAVDIPSGLCADTGVPLGCAVKASLTTTFIGMKQGLLTGQGREFCGQLKFADLNVPEEVYEKVAPSCDRLSESSLSALVSIRSRVANKGDHGHVLVVGGNHGMPGAVIMAAEAAIHCGAGKVTVATRADHLTALAIRKPEVMASGISSGKELQQYLKNKNAIVIGPGLGQDEWAKSLLSTALAAQCPVVLDADALNLIADDPQLLKAANCPMIFTPHPGEAGRLLNKSISEVSENRFAAITTIAERFQATVLMKGSGSLIYDGGRLSLCSAGNPGMAVAGMGDVLSGVIGALLAQGLNGWDATRLGVWLHASGADELVGNQGEIGMQATETIPYIRRQLNRLAKNQHNSALIHVRTKQ